MPIYTKKTSKEWIKAFKEFEVMSGFEIMHQEEIDNGSMSCQEVWDQNQRWLENLLSDVSRIETPQEGEE